MEHQSLDFYTAVVFFLLLLPSILCNQNTSNGRHSFTDWNLAESDENETDFLSLFDTFFSSWIHDINRRWNEINGRRTGRQCGR